MDDKLVTGVKSAQVTILAAYQQKFAEMHRELQALKTQLGEEQVALRRDAEISTISGERDHSHIRVLRLEETLRQRNEAYRQLELQYQEAVAERNMVIEKYKTAVRENRELQHQTAAKIVPEHRSRMIRNAVQSLSQNGARAFYSPDTSRRDVGNATAQTQNLSGTSPGQNVEASSVISSLKRQLEIERARVRGFIAERVSARAKDAELKEFLLSSIEEVKKDIVMRSSGSASERLSEKNKFYYTGTVTTGPAENPDSARGTKTSPRTVRKPWTDDSGREMAPPQLSAFTATDKRQIFGHNAFG